MAEAAGKELSNVEKAAVLLLCMDEKTTGQLFAQMEDEEIREIGSALLKLHQIPMGQVESVMNEFAQGVIGNARILPTNKANFFENNLEIDGQSIAERVLSKSLARGRSEGIIKSLGAPTQSKASKRPAAEDIDLASMLASLTVKDIKKLFGDEHPQVLALILSQVQRKVGREYLKELPDLQQLELLNRMARLEKISKEAMQDLAEYVAQLMDERAKAAAAAGSSGAVVEDEEEVEKDVDITGFEQTLKLLKSLDREKAMELVEKLKEQDPEIGELVAKRMFTVEDLVRADDPGIRELLRGVSNEDLKIALKETPDEVKNKFFKNMSERASMILREDMEVLPSLKVEDIEAAQERVLEVAKNLMKEEKLKLEAIPDED